MVNYAPWLSNLIRRSLMTMMTSTEVKGQPRSNVVIYVLWQPRLIRLMYPLYKLRMLMMTFMEVIKAQIVNHAL